jgi:uncharacterized Zn-binding protein involved in type VI secretion
MSVLISVLGDPNSHGDGQLLASNNSGKVFINNLKVNYVGSSASADVICFVAGPPHCDPLASSGSGKVFAEGMSIHRHGDSRVCGASTVVEGQSKVFAGG